MIRVVVQVTGVSPEPVRVFVSLSTDRETDGGGYRSMEKVMSDKQFREILLADAKNEMENFIRRYQRLSELSRVFLEMHRALGKGCDVDSGRKSKAKT